MVRITMIMLCFLLAAAAAGRYQAEVSVRETRREIESIDRSIAKELSEIQVLRAEIAYLESPDRLAKIAARHTTLRPLSGAQLMTADEFLLAFSDSDTAPRRSAPPANRDVIMHAIAMADLGTVQ